MSFSISEFRAKVDSQKSHKGDAKAVIDRCGGSVIDKNRFEEEIRKISSERSLIWQDFNDDVYKGLEEYKSEGKLTIEKGEQALEIVIKPDFYETPDP